MFTSPCPFTMQCRNRIPLGRSLHIHISFHFFFFFAQLHRSLSNCQFSTSFSRMALKAKQRLQRQQQQNQQSYWNFRNLNIDADFFFCIYLFFIFFLVFFVLSPCLQLPFFSLFSCSCVLSEYLCVRLISNDSTFNNNSPAKSTNDRHICKWKKDNNKTHSLSHTCRRRMNHKNGNRCRKHTIQ